MTDKELAQKIVDNLGGKSNITRAMHCVTRLRFQLNDEKKADLEEINKLQGVLRAQVEGSQYQIVIGANVASVFDQVVPLLDNSGDGAEAETVDNKKPEKKTAKSFLGSIVNLCGGVFVPFLPALVAGGIIKGILSIIDAFHLLPGSNGTIATLNLISDIPFYFMPFFLALSMAKIVKISEHLALCVACALMYPTFVAAIGKASPFSFLGIPIPVFSYSGSVFPVIFGVAILAFVYKRIDKIIPKTFKILVVPTLSLLITIPATLIIFAPIGSYLALGLANGMLWLFNTFGPLMAFALGFTYPILVMTGINQSYSFIQMYNINAGVGDYTLPISLVSNFAQAGASLGVGIRSKKGEERATAFTCCLSAIIGITEPAMYTVNLPKKKPYVCAMIGSGIASALTWILSVRCFAYVMPGIFSLPNYLAGKNPIMNFISILVCIATSFIISTVLTVVTYSLAFKGKKSKDKDVVNLKTDA